MTRSEIREKLIKKLLCHDVATAMSAIPVCENDITPEKLRSLLEKGRFHDHEIANIYNVVFR